VLAGLLGVDHSRARLAGGGTRLGCENVILRRRSMPTFSHGQDPFQTPRVFELFPSMATRSRSRLSTLSALALDEAAGSNLFAGVRVSPDCERI
jgi:hypothetical protein